MGMGEQGILMIFRLIIAIKNWFGFGLEQTVMLAHEVDDEPKEAPVDEAHLDVQPPWLIAIKKYQWVKELTGKNDHAQLDAWWQRFNLGWLIGQPWCGLIIAVVFADLGYPVPKTLYRAKSWLDWGETIDEPVIGALVIFSRTGGHHVAIVEAITNDGRLMCWGGNQGNAVNCKPFSTDRVMGYRVPRGYRGEPLEVVVAQVESSKNEA